MKPIRKLLAANRSEIATRIFRSAHELQIRTVAIYSHEDRFALHRFKADEAYQIGKQGEPIRSYLDIPGIVQLCIENQIDAVHPGYGFCQRTLSSRELLKRLTFSLLGQVYGHSNCSVISGRSRYRQESWRSDFAGLPQRSGFVIGCCSALSETGVSGHA